MSQSTTEPLPDDQPLPDGPDTTPTDPDNAPDAPTPVDPTGDPAKGDSGRVSY